MFRISRRLDYGLQLMIALAQEPENRAQATSRIVAMSFCEPRSCRLQLSS